MGKYTIKLVLSLVLNEACLERSRKAEVIAEVMLIIVHSFDKLRACPEPAEGTGPSSGVIFLAETKINAQKHFLKTYNTRFLLSLPKKDGQVLGINIGGDLGLFSSTF